MVAWNPEANEIFLKTMEIGSSSDRRDYLDKACHGDSELRAQVQSLIHAS